MQTSALEWNSTAVAAAKADPENHLLWHARVRRRDAESIRDTTLQVSGHLNWRMFGASAQPELPKPLMESRYAWYPSERPEERDRRSVYVYACRNLQVPLFSAFDVPDRFNSCPTRAVTTTAPQALVLLNGQFSIDEAQHMSAMLVKQYGSDVRALIRHAYLAVYSRRPSRDEVSAAEEFLGQQTRRIAAAGGSTASAAAVADFCHALMNAAEFLYVE
jgi:hypothetical protein